jgi:hypothetical protein
MSCFIVDSHHIRALVSWAALHRVTYYMPAGRQHVETAGDGQRVAELLHRANLAAFADRYPREGAALAEPFDYRPVAASWLPAIQIVKACDCLDYQCSDWTGWPDSEARRILRAIREKAIRMLPGYEAAAWELRP